jgi:acylphosphatase
MAKIQANIIITGMVQGVVFRWFIKERADDLGVTGWVKNQPDGSVKILALGERNKIKELITAAEQGPRFAQIADIKVDWQKPKNKFTDFEIVF